MGRTLNKRFIVKSLMFYFSVFCTIVRVDSKYAILRAYDLPLKHLLPVLYSLSNNLGVIAMSECASEEAISWLEWWICFAERLEVLTGWLSFNCARSALVPGRQILLALAQKYSKTLAKIITINPSAYPRPVFWRAYASGVYFYLT